tara:strand:+ start:117834 stop:118475 length:642 start_codon:yes stop_codon:yes gene_type:complete
MGWLWILLLLMAVGLGLVWLGRLPRSLWELVGAALLFGVAGYAWQGMPTLPGEPRNAAQSAPGFDEDMVKLRRSFGGEYGEAGSWLTMSDGFARQGQSRDAANVLLSGLRDHPDDPALWIGLGNALVAHGEGILSPSAEYSYQQAMRIAPDNYAAPYFYGLALAQSGQYAGARKIWGALAEKLPETAPLRGQLQANLAQLDRLLAGQSAPQPR